MNFDKYRKTLFNKMWGKLNMKQTRKKYCIFTALFLYVCSVVCMGAVQPGILDSAELKIALKKLLVLGSVLYIAPHPDDENTALLAFFSKEKLLCTGYLSLTRGGGGQNLIGREQGEMLSLVRTHELLAARAIDGAEQLLTRAIDFGYSKSAEESIAVWGKNEILADLVWIIRKFKPDVLITRFPAAEGGHGHHTACTILAVEAFNMAADPKCFPGQLKYLSVWQPKRILWNAWRQLLENRSGGLTGLPFLDIGKYNPLLGKSYTEIAALSRSMHKTQGFGSVGRRGEWLDYFDHLAGTRAANDLFEDVDLSWDKVPGAGRVKELLQKANDSFSAEDPAGILPVLIEALHEMKRLPESFWTVQKMGELLDVIRSSGGVWIEAATDKYCASPGGEIKVTVTLVNRSAFPFTLESIAIPGWGVKIDAREELLNNKPVVKEIPCRLNRDIPYSIPYWLKEKPGKGAYRVSDPQTTGLPETPEPVSAAVVLGAGGEQLNYSIPLVYRWRDPAAGERIRSLEIVPPLTVNFLEEVFYFPNGASRKIRIKIQSGPAPASGKLEIDPGKDWRADPALISFNIEKEFSELEVMVEITPPQKDSTSNLAVHFIGDRKEKAYSLSTIDYPHIPLQSVLVGAEATLVRVGLEKKGNKLAYIMGSGDDIPKYLASLGYEVKTLSDEELQQEDLQGYDAVVMGVRAYNTRPVLKTQQQRLLDYVFKGGNLVVQYNVDRDLLVEQIGPFPIKLSRSRVTEEDAVVTLLEPGHPILNSPNKILAADFDNWIQERGLYFAAEWAPEYKAPLSCFDKGETPQAGGLLAAPYGKGNFIYSGYAFFRQIPGGVPGALKLFINMISLDKRK